MIPDVCPFEGRMGKKIQDVQALSNAICAAKPTLTEADCTAIAVRIYIVSEFERWLKTESRKRMPRWERRIEASWDRCMERALDRKRRQR
jgi:hypothetical protein